MDDEKRFDEVDDCALDEVSGGAKASIECTVVVEAGPIKHESKGKAEVEVEVQTGS